MSQRERWIIYPLLFFCFAMCIKVYWRTEYFDIDAKTVTCQTLLLKDQADRPLLAAGGRPNGDGFLMVYAAPTANAPGRAPLEAVRLGVSPNRRGVVAAFSEIGQPVVELTGSPRGGNVVLFDATGRPALVTRVPRLSGDAPAKPDDPRTAPVRPPVPPGESPAAPSPAVGSEAT